MNLISTLKKTVTSIQDILDPLGINRNKPRFLFIEDKGVMTDPAGNPRTNVYKREINLGNGPAN
ncbi:MAG TPA: hypothetical protein VD993_10460 [Chitinophagaceae bacterium]|nr:hypothetical protein [Chitinophagaceae bacterium]